MKPLEDLFDVQLRPLARSRALLVLARDQLADQAEREELQPDHDEEHAEDEQRPLPDRVALDLQHRQVAQHYEAKEAEGQAKAAEEMERPVPVAPDERHGEQVEEPAQ